jgi:hypothetical protein
LTVAWYNDERSGGYPPSRLTNTEGIVPEPKRKHEHNEVDDDPQAVVVTDPEPADPERKRDRVSTADILQAIRSIPDAVAAKVEGKPEPSSGSAGPQSVVFEPEPEPEPDEVDPDEPAPGPAPAPVNNEPRFRHPSRARRRVEIGT